MNRASSRGILYFNWITWNQSDLYFYFPNVANLLSEASHLRRKRCTQFSSKTIFDHTNSIAQKIATLSWNWLPERFVLKSVTIRMHSAVSLHMFCSFMCTHLYQSACLLVLKSLCITLSVNNIKVIRRMEVTRALSLLILPNLITAL